MATDLVQAVFSGVKPGTDLGSFGPSAGAGFARHPSYAGNGIVATAAGRFRAASPGTDCIYYSPTAPPSADYSVRLKATYLSVSGSDFAGLTIRTAAEDSFYALVWARFDAIQVSGLAIYKHVGGTPALVAGPVAAVAGASTVPAAGASALLELAVSGTTVKGYFNGVEALSATDTSLTAAGFGGIYLRTAAADDASGPQVEAAYINNSPAFVPLPDSAAGTGTGSGGGSISGTGTGTGTATQPLTIPVTSVGHWCSPLNWDDDGTGPKPANGVRPGASAIWSACNGAHGRFRWATPAAASNVATLLVDAGPLIAGAVPPNLFPMVKYRINDGPYRVAQVAAGTNGILALDVTGAGVAGAGTYTLRYHLMATDQGQPRWSPPPGGTIPPNVLKVTGLAVDPGSTPAAPTVLPKTLAVFGDSITEGVRATGTAVSDLASNDSTLTYARALAAALGAELAAVGFGGQGWARPGSGGVPDFPDAFGSYSAGRPRDFAPAVDYVVCVQGTNDGLNGAAAALVPAASAAWLATARGRFGAAAQVFLAVPPGGFCRSELAAGFKQYQAATPDPRAYLVDGGTGLQSGLTGFVAGGTFAAVDGVHPDFATHGRVAAALLEAISTAVGNGQATPPDPTRPAGPVAPSGATFAQLRAGGLSGQVEALIRANPGLAPAVVDGLRAGRSGGVDGAYRGLASLVESYLRGDPIATPDIDARLGNYAAIFAGYAQAAAEVAALAGANPGTIVNQCSSAHAVNSIARRSFA